MSLPGRALLAARRRGRRTRAAIARRRALRLYREIAGERLAFDIGANRGAFTELLLEAGAAVVAVEPQPAFAAHISPRATVECVAVGAEPGTARLIGAGERLGGLATLSEEWTRRLVASGRELDGTWGESIEVHLVTLDELVARYGVPAYCKIDTEGWDDQVLAGLSQPVETVSFEFVSEAIDVAQRATARLEALGPYRFAFAPEETWRLGAWRTRDELLRDLAALRHLSWGDVYAQLVRT